MMRIILIGGDETVYFLARQLKRKQHEVVIINKDKAHCEQLYNRTQALVLHGDGSNQRILEEAGARRADVVLALTPNDHDNLIASQIAQTIYGVPRTIALVNDPENEEIFKKLGVTHAFSSTRIIATMIEQQANFDDIKRLMPMAHGKVQISDVQIDRDSPALGKTLMDINLSENTLIAAIIRDDEFIIPRGSNQLRVGDHVLIISKAGMEAQDLALLMGDQP